MAVVVTESKVDEKKRLLAELEAVEADLKAQLKLAEEADPFWFYQPSNGVVSDEQNAFMAEFLRPEDIPHRLDCQLDVHLSDASISLCSGGNQCLAPEQKIYDPVKKLSIPVSQIKDAFHVWAWDGNKLLVALAEKPFRKGKDAIYNIELSNGMSFRASMSHLLLTSSGYLAISCLLPLFSRSRQPTILGISPLVHDEDGQNFFRIAQDFLYDYRLYHDFYDAQPLSDSSTSRDVFPSRDDVPEHRELVFGRKDGQAYKSTHNHFYLSCGHPSNLDVGYQSEVRAFEILSCASCNTFRPIYHLRRVLHRLRDALVHQSRSIYEHLPIYQHRHKAIYNRERSIPSKSSLVSSIVVTKVTYLRDDFKWDFTVPEFNNYWCSGIIHHNSGKTLAGCIEAFIKATGEVPDSLKNIYPESKLPKSFPNYIRVVGEDYQNGLLKNVIPTYKQWAPREYLVNGKWEDSFSAEQVTLRLVKQGKLFGAIEFMSNKQEVGSFQGPARHKIIYDEEPRQDIYKENLMRFTTSEKLDILFTMTPTKGLSWVNDEILGKESDETGNRIDCFKIPSATNKKANLKVLREILGKLDSYEEIKMRLLGEFVSLSGIVYKSFDKRIHLIEPFEVRNKPEFYVLRGMDLHMVTPHAVVFIAIDRENIVYVVDCYFKDRDTREFKKEMTDLSKGYRLGWSVTDKSCDSTIRAFGDRNIYREVTRGENAIRNLRKSEKYEGSIHAGVDEIKQRLKINPATGKPSLFFFNTANNRLLINAMRTMERETYGDEDLKGPKDKIRESKHHHHAALRYLFQFPVRWQPETVSAPVLELDEEVLY